MRKSLEELINTMYTLKTHLSAAKYELYDYDDGAYADIKVENILEPKRLNATIGHLQYKILADEVGLRIRVFEDFNEYA